MEFVIAVRCFKRGFAGLLCALATALPAWAAAPPAVGDTYVYRVVNGYNGEVLSRLRYRIERVEPDRLTFRVTPDTSAGGVERTEIVTPEGNWLLHPMESHGQAVTYEFTAPLPAYALPLEPGKSWSVRVAGRAQGDNRVRSIRVDGDVLGRERVRVPAGEFDALKVRRSTYPGDAEYFLGETKVWQTDWYVPALGRSVRTETRSLYIDNWRSRIKVTHGGWYIHELVEVPAAAAR